METMSFAEINPFVRYAQFLTITSSRQYVNIAPYDYRLFFCVGGSGTITVDGTSYDMKIGSFLSWPPGLRYSLLLTPGSKKMDLMQVNFDYTRDFAGSNEPLPPAKWRNFNPDKILQKIEFFDCREFNTPVFISEIQFLSNPMYNMVTEFISKKNFYSARTSGQLKSILSLSARFVRSSQNSRGDFLVNKVIQYIHTHYREEVTNNTLGDYFGYHPNHLNRLIVQHTGMSVHKYLINCRIDAAIDLLQASDLKTSEVAEAVGFKDPTHFLKYFKKLTGKNTRDFRQ